MTVAATAARTTTYSHTPGTMYYIVYTVYMYTYIHTLSSNYSILYLIILYQVQNFLVCILYCIPMLRYTELVILYYILSTLHLLLMVP